MKTARCGPFARLLIAIPVSSIGATALPEQEYVRDSVPKLFSYDELAQLSLDQQMHPALAEKLRLVVKTKHAA